MSQIPSSLLHSSALTVKYGLFWFQETKTATAKMPNFRLQNGSPQTNGWRHGGYVHYVDTVYVTEVPEYVMPCMAKWQGASREKLKLASFVIYINFGEKSSGRFSVKIEKTWLQWRWYWWLFPNLKVKVMVSMLECFLVGKSRTELVVCSSKFSLRLEVIPRFFSH